MGPRATNTCRTYLESNTEKLKNPTRPLITTTKNKAATQQVATSRFGDHQEAETAAGLVAAARCHLAALGCLVAALAASVKAIGSQAMPINKAEIVVVVVVVVIVVLSELSRVLLALCRQQGTTLSDSSQTKVRSKVRSKELRDNAPPSTEKSALQDLSARLC